MSRVILIGLDGATWEILEPLSKEGILPNIKNLIDNGIKGVLQSTIPPVSAPAWISIATGMNPGETGIYDFLVREDNRLIPVTSRHFRGKAFWDLLTNSGKKVGVVNYPLLFPPYPVEGFMIGGIVSLEFKNFCYPPELLKEINEISDGYEIMVRYHEEKYNDINIFLEEVNRVINKREKVILHLMEEKEWDMLTIIFSCTDWFQHLMWKYVDTSSADYDDKTSQYYSNEFKKLWERLDQIIGKIIEFGGEDCDILIVSDHGFGSQKGCFNLARWLKEKGYISTTNKTTISKSITHPTAKFVRKTPLKKLVPSHVAGDLYRRTKKNITDQIDFEKSTAYVMGHTIPFGGIYLNPLITKDETSHNTLKKKLLDDLKNIPEEIGKELDVRIYLNEELYGGNQTKSGPNIILTINDWSCIIKENSFEDPVYEDKAYSERHTGSHRMNGIFLACGPNIEPLNDKTYDFQIYDIMPTVLHMCNIPIPNYVSGRALKEIFKSDSKYAKGEEKYQESKEKDIIKEKIKDLKKLDRI